MASQHPTSETADTYVEFISWCPSSFVTSPDLNASSTRSQVAFVAFDPPGNGMLANNSLERKRWARQARLVDRQLCRPAQLAVR